MKLSYRQRQLLGMLHLGLSNREIAEQLSLSENTIEKYLGNLYKKIGVRGRVEAIAWRDDMFKREREQATSADSFKPDAEKDQ